MDWNWLIWYGIGIASGVAIGHEEIEKKLKSRFKNLYTNKGIKCIDKNGNEISYERLIKILFKRNL